MTKTKKIFAIVLASITLMLAVTMAMFGTKVFANSKDGENSDGAIARLFTNLSFNLYGENGYISATAKNEFTLFTSVVYVNVQLFTSDTYQSSFETMTMVGTNVTEDLDMGKSISVTYPTNGQQKYWIGRIIYRENGGVHQIRVTECALFSAEGEFIGFY